MVKCLNIGKNIGKPIYWSISGFDCFYNVLICKSLWMKGPTEKVTRKSATSGKNEYWNLIVYCVSIIHFFEA